MKVEFSPHFLRSYRKAPALVQRAFDKQSALLLEDPRHPSLRLKKYGVSGNVWQARVNDSWRILFHDRWRHVSPAIPLVGPWPR
jgi:mRNA-degrading endonuclease RelE of RelBE toxin-antitoxin system